MSSMTPFFKGLPQVSALGWYPFARVFIWKTTAGGENGSDRN